MGFLDNNESLTPEDKSAIEASIASIKARTPFMVNLTYEEIQKLRKFSISRHEFGVKMNLAANQQPELLPDTFDLNGYNAKIKFVEDIIEIYVLALPWYEGLKDTLMAAQADVVAISDIVYGYINIDLKKCEGEK